MVSMGLQLLGYAMAFLGYIGTLTTTLLPTWKTSSYIGSSIVTAVSFTKGLWMECATYSTGITQCDIYSSLLNLPTDIQAAQALMVSSCVISSLACLLTVVGMRCTVFSQGSPGKDRVAVAGGMVFILGGLLCFIPMVWNIHVVLRDFHNPILPDSMKFELGEALYLGIISSLLSLIGGFILSTSCPSRDPTATYTSSHQPRLLAGKSLQPSVSQTQKTKSELNSYNLTGYV
ncbi:Claudin-2 [Balearica regulorum gibbericeps]|uniref:Claudin n=1 Tax=Balearica regulorum gibbericeps TaxID=100784 RepID=A0A087V289_BALRE|nr:PREDICTED: claudin-2 [Balearica regulorum gibbericeps]KFO06731.1 Claudin-2 [Balearica regulorum gibbericeps]